MSTPSTPLKKTANYYYGLGIFVAFFLAVIQIVSALSEDTCRPSVQNTPTRNSISWRWSRITGTCMSV
ncbi:hypothetical protein [Endozoicomonas sp. ALB032]|uniref:hypothetical protein n=1 Tax=Endozoicomonas sp. ALB032 TaxID=3403082 RepID=UPI003BB50CA4